MPFAGGEADPIGPDEGAALLGAAFADPSGDPVAGPVLLAVSGGPDSVAMLAIASQCRADLSRIGIEFHVATVDHGLRPAAAEEADGVARLAVALGLPHHHLRWQGEKPISNLQAAARSARYGLLEEAARAFGAGAIVTAHHEDDQIETHALARRRHAGSRGLAGMRARRDLAPGIVLLRPFLGVAGGRLRATAAAAGWPTVEDPSNGDDRFERVRIRRRLAVLDEGERQAILAAIACHRDARDAADRALALAIDDDDALGGGPLSADPFGRVRCPADRLRALAPALRAELLGRILVAVGGGEHPPARAGLDRIAAEIVDAGIGRAGTLGGVRVEAGPALVFAREFGRTGPAPIAFREGGAGTLFDRRFIVSLPESAPRVSPGAGSRLVAFGMFGRGNAAERTLPVLVDDAGRLLAVPETLAQKAGDGLGRLSLASRVDWRLRADLPRSPRDLGAG